MATNNAVNINATGIIKYDGAGTFTATTTTNHNLLIGAASNAITNVAPSATSGVPVISQGSSADPTFGTVVVAGGGTGNTSTTAYAVQCGGTTSTGNHQNVSGVGTTGQVLTSNGAGALPTWQASGASTPALQTFSGSLTNTQIKNLIGTPVTLISAAGSGVVIIIINYQIKLIYGGTNNFNSNGTAQLQYAASGATAAAGIVCTGWNDTTSNAYGLGPGLTALTAVSAANSENSAIRITNTGSAIGGNAANNNTWNINIVYYTISI
jgi:hypothetical protein